MLHGKPGGYKKSAHLQDGQDIGVDLAGGFYDAGGEQLLLPALCTIKYNLRLKFKLTKAQLDWNFL